MPGASRPFSYTLAAPDTFKITAAMGVYALSYQVSGTDGDNATFLGSGKLPAADGQAEIDSAPVIVPAGGGNNIVPSQANQALDGITITANQGTVGIILGF